MWIDDEEQFFEAYFETGYGRKDKAELDLAGQDSFF